VFLYEENMSLKQVFDFKKDLKILMLVLPALALALFLFVYSQSQTPKSWTSGGTDRVSYMITELFVMVHYVDNFFFPFNLSADTDWGLVNSIFDDRAIMGFCFIVFTLYLAYKASINPQSRPIAYGILWFYLALVPTSSVVPFSEVLNDHRVFFPYIGLAMAVVWALFLVYKKYEVTITKSSWMRTAILVFIGVFLCAHVYGVRQRCHIWSSDDLLWKDVTEKSPRNGRGLMNYGLVLMGRGDYPGALEYYNKAKQEWPYYSYIYVNLGVLYSATHDPVESEKNFKYALQLNPNNPNCYFYYAIMLKDNKRIAEAKEQVAKGLALSPHHPDLVNFLTDLNTNPAYVASEQERAALMKKKLDDMAAAAKQANTPEAYLNLSLEYYNNGQYLECAHAAEESVRLKPDYDLAYNNICTAYNMLKDWDKAIAAGQKAIVINPNNIQAKNNLQVSLDGKKAAGK
jgi:Tfp pilus assembly protein PilF